MEKNELNESLNRFRELLKYDVKNGKSSLDERRMHSYTDDTDYADEEETEEEGTEGGEEGGDNPDFDFGGGEETEGGEEEGGFGEEPEGGEEETEEEGGEEDEFGTADEFSAADEIEDEESDVEEIDVTDIVKRADDAKSYSEKAVKAAEEGKGMIQDLMSKFDSLQQSLSKIDSVANEINVIKSDLQSQKPKEKLELRSLDSYPFNVKLTDYWNDEKLKDNYEITSGAPDAESKDGQVKVWKVSPEDAKEYNPGDIKKSFVPESKSKKKVLTENPLVRSLGKSAAVVAPLAALVLYVQYENFISVTDKNGTERRPEKGETFVGKIIELEEPKYIKGGTIVTIETKNGEIIKFQHTTMVRANVGETVKVKVETGTFMWPDYNIKHTNESKNKKKRI